MQERLLNYIRRHGLMNAGDRVGVAVSGGADSVALLRLLLEVREKLGVVLAVVHFNHKLRGEESDGDEWFVRELAKAHGLEFHGDSADTRAYAEEHKCGIEAGARKLRYGFFWRLLSPQGTQRYAGETTSTQRTQRDAKEELDRIATAHTMDDQAETVLLRLLRGAGTKGLAGIYPVLYENKGSLARDDKGGGVIVRPLLEFRRDELRDYLKQHSQAWREDASNEDTTFARNKVRRELMPKLREVNPSIEQVLSEAAEIARGDESYWQQVVEKSVDGRWSMVDGKHLLEQPLALRRRMVRAVAERRGIALEFRHVEQILELVAQPATRAEKRVELPGEWDAVVQERELRFARRCPKQQNDSYEYALSVPGKVEVEAAGLTIAARFLERGEGDLLDPGRIGSLHIRNWRPGDRYRPAHTRQAKKLKELLQARSVPAEFRAHWPVVVSQIEGREEIVWVPGFACAEGFLRAHGSASGIRLEHKPR